MDQKWPEISEENVRRESILHKENSEGKGPKARMRLACTKAEKLLCINIYAIQ